MKKRPRLLIAFIVITMLGLALAGCGDRNTTTPTEPTRPTRDIIHDPNAPNPPTPPRNPDETLG